MTVTGWVEIILVLAFIVLTAWPLGVFMARLLAGERTFLHPVLGPVERGFYALAGVDPAKPMGWKQYTIALIVLNAVHFLMLYAILRLQAWLPFNPQGFSNLSPTLAFNTAISFVTNTNWQAYTGESTMSNFSQMVGLTSHMFVSAATGIAAAAAVARRPRSSRLSRRVPSTSREPPRLRSETTRSRDRPSTPPSWMAWARSCSASTSTISPS